MKVSTSKWKKTSNLFHHIMLAVAASLLYAIRRKEKKLKRKAKTYANAAIPGLPKIRRARHSVEDV
jgi:transposase